MHEAMAYLAGLFDGEGCVSYKQYMRKRSHNKKAYPTWQIRLEMAMTDKSMPEEFKQVLSDGIDEIDLIRSGLDDMMIEAYQKVKIIQKESNISDLRTAAFKAALEKIAVSYETIGL